MNGPNEFWLSLHRVSTAYRDEGTSGQERFNNVVAQFRQMPAIARRELLADFALVAGNFHDLYVACVAAHRDDEREPDAKRPGADVA